MLAWYIDQKRNTGMCGTTDCLVNVEPDLWPLQHLR